MTSNLLFLLGTALAVFLLGANSAFLIHLGNRLTRWFTFKLLAVSGLLVYVGLSLSLGAPGEWRGAIAVAAMLLDVGALIWMWWSVEHMYENRITGLIPLGRIEHVEQMLDDLVPSNDRSNG